MYSPSAQIFVAFATVTAVSWGSGFSVRAGHSQPTARWRLAKPAVVGYFAALPSAFTATQQVGSPGSEGSP